MLEEGELRLKEATEAIRVEQDKLRVLVDSNERMKKDSEGENEDQRRLIEKRVSKMIEHDRLLNKGLL